MIRSFPTRLWALIGLALGITLAGVGGWAYASRLSELSCSAKPSLPVPSSPQVYMTEIDGGSPQHVGAGYTVSWSPGETIAYTAFPKAGATRPTGMLVTVVEQTEHRPVISGDYPQWSPDGKRLAYGVGGGISIIAASGTGQQWVIRPSQPGDFDEKYPAAWSPDGTKLLFWSPKAAGGEIFVVNVDGSGRTRLAEGRNPSWSPDGGQVAFAARRDDNFDIYVINSDGTGEQRLTSFPGSDLTPAWSPDGRKIAFSSERRCDLDIWVMDADGGNPVQVTKTRAEEEAPAWSPDGKRLAYVARHNRNEGPAPVLVSERATETPSVTVPGLTTIPFWTQSPSRTAPTPSMTTPTPSRTSPTPDPRWPLDPRLLVLPANELPQGFVLDETESSYSDNQQAARGDASALERYQRLGRVIGYHARFKRDPASASLRELFSALNVEQFVSVYKTPEGASESLRQAIQELPPNAQLQSLNIQDAEAFLITSDRVEPLSQEQLRGQSIEFTDMDVVVLRGQIAVRIRITGLKGTTSTEQAVALARRAAEIVGSIR